MPIERPAAHRQTARPARRRPSKPPARGDRPTGRISVRNSQVHLKLRNIDIARMNYSIWSHPSLAVISNG